MHNMTRKLRGSLWALGALGIILPLCGAEGNKRLVEATNSQTVPFQPGGTIHFNHSFGVLAIEGWDKPEVEITVTKSLDQLAGTKDQAELAKHLEKVAIAVERRSDTDLEITTTVPHYSRLTHPFGSTGGVMVEYQIHAPRNSKLVIQHGTGDVSATDMTADIDATVHNGDIVLMLPESGLYSIDAKSKLGTVWSDFDGDFQRRHLMGTQYAHPGAAPAHRIFLRMGTGGITIKSSPPSAHPPATASVQ